MSHAILSPSSASRWLSCTPSARLEQQFPDTAGEAAKEGTLAHALAELLLSFKLGKITKQKYTASLKKIQRDPLYTADMQAHIDDYVVYVMERISEASASGSVVVRLEEKLNLTEWIPEGLGTADVAIIADGTLDVIDLKFGKGVPVDAFENKQMMIYGLGAYSLFSLSYDIRNVRLSIFQPRIDNYSTYEISVDELMLWADSEMAPKAKAAFDGTGSFAPGEHCRFCKARGACKALAEHNLVIAKHDFKAVELLSPEEIADILDRASSFKNWIKGVEDYALEQALQGVKWPGYKLVEGRSNRAYLDEQQVADKLIAAGISEDKIFKKSLLTITNMEKSLSKAVFNDLLSPLVVKPKGAPTLTVVSDKRPEINSTDAALSDFEHILIEQ